MVITGVHPQALLDAVVEGADTEARSPFALQATMRSLYLKPIPCLLSDRAFELRDRRSFESLSWVQVIPDMADRLF